MDVVTISVVSHGQGRLVASLLDDLAKVTDVSLEIILTLNLPENESFIPMDPPYRLKVLRNGFELGFGANHNQAFTHATGAWFFVVNPDIRVPQPTFAPLVEILRQEDVGICGPVVLSPSGTVEDHARRFPTPVGLIGRRLGLSRGRDYDVHYGLGDIDWLAGMFLCFACSVYAQLSGFDERYFMYYEDVDICRRMRRSGRRICVEPRVSVIHAAQRASWRSWRHLRWHLASAARYFIQRGK